MKEIVFKDGNINKDIDMMKERLAEWLNVSKDKIKAVGVRFYFLDEEDDILQTTDFFSKDFNPDDYGV